MCSYQGVTQLLLAIKPGCHLCKSAGIYALARALVMIAKKFVIFPNVQLAHKYARIYALIYTSGIQA
jgi:hypothetical protein